MKSKYDLLKYFAELGFTTGAEIGVAKGYFSRKMCEIIPNLKLYSIDSWASYTPEWSNEKYKMTIKTLAPFNATVIRKTSMEAVKDFKDNSLDFVFIDASHFFPRVLEDITEWSKKVRIGGIVSGDDYYSTNNSGVIRAVEKYTKEHNIKFNLTDPYPDKIKDRRKQEQPVFWWIKEEYK